LKRYPPDLYFFGATYNPPLDVRLILLVLCAGALGSVIHATTSFIDYVGNRTLVTSWLLWYLLRPFIGAALALILYFLLRGGFMTGTAQPADAAVAASLINPFGVAALAALAGLFTKQATDKLNEVFSTLFRPAPGQGDAKRGDKIVPAKTPNIASMSPATASKGAASLRLNINGSNFAENAIVRFGRTTLKSQRLSDTVITAELTAAELTETGTFRVVVVNPDTAGAAGLASNEKDFEVVT